MGSLLYISLHLIDAVFFRGLWFMTKFQYDWLVLCFLLSIDGNSAVHLVALLRRIKRKEL